MDGPAITRNRIAYAAHIEVPQKRFLRCLVIAMEEIVASHCDALLLALTVFRWHPRSRLTSQLFLLLSFSRCLLPWHGRALVTAMEDGFLRGIAVRSSSLLHLRSHPTSHLPAFLVLPWHGSALVMAMEDGSLRICQAGAFSGADGSIRCVQLSNNFLINRHSRSKQAVITVGGFNQILPPPTQSSAEAATADTSADESFEHRFVFFRGGSSEEIDGEAGQKGKGKLKKGQKDGGEELEVDIQGSVAGSELRSATGSASSPLMVECFEVERCEGLEGHVSISGAKNSALAVLAGAICSSEPLVLRRVPDLHDIRRMFQVLQSVGVKIQRGVDGQDSSVLVDASCLSSVEPCPDVVRKLRASFFVIGALVGRQGEAVVPLPGGCNIGARPIDLHVRGLEALGAKVDIRQGRVHVQTADGGRLKGGSFYLDFPSVGATETLMMAASLADGETTLSNVAQEPEVVDLADFLISCGAQIRGAGTNTIVIKGVPRLGPAEFTIIPDRIEAGTFLAAAAITRSVVSLSPVIPRHLMAVISKLRAMGCRVQQTKIGTLKISPGIWPLRAADVTTLPYPGFPTDMQPQLMAALTTASGQSVIRETVFESRMRHVEELQKMGAKIKITGNTAIISGRDQGSQLYGAPVAATDLRAGAALVLAGMAAEGRTHIEGVAHIDRGYERLDTKLRGLGARIQRLPCLPAELTL
ncbi:unnamed protein product [Closterium sp. NIES-65]|nr:unnamed protein product [Closterium sp. NIES-65]